jgi:outer membrane protein, heavy metal efflux system
LAQRHIMGVFYTLLRIPFIFFPVVQATWLLLPACLAADTLELEAYLAQVEEANPIVDSARHSAEAEARRVRPAGAWDDPFISFGPDDMAIGAPMGMLRYTVGQGIPFPGKSAARRAAAQYRAQTAQYNTRTASRELALAATSVYYQAVLAEQTVTRNEEIRDLLTQIAESERVRYSAGRNAHHGWLLAKLEADLLETELLRLRRDLETWKATLNELRNQPLNTPIRLPQTLPEIETAQPISWEESLAAQPQRQALTALTQAAGEDIRAAKRAFFPDFMVQGMFMQSLHEDEPHAWGAMLGFSVPLFWGGKQSESLAAARFTRAALDADRIALENRLEVVWHDAVRQLRTAVEVYTQYRDVVLPRTLLAEDAARSAYASDLMSVREYLDILRVRRVLQIEMLAARLDVALSEARLREFIAAPPMLRLAPMRPTLFGGAGMGMGAAPMGMQPEGPPMPAPSPRTRDMPGMQPAMPGTQEMRGMQ